MKIALVPGEHPRFVDCCCPNVEDHIAQTRLEFVKQPELCAYHAELVIRLRRKIDTTRNAFLFFDLWRAEQAFLLQHLDSRWLVSALDTFADYGAARERLAATAIVAFVNMVKLAETEHRLCGSPDYSPDCVRQNIEQYPEMWDGRRVFHLRDDDTFGNTVTRMRRVLEPEPLLRDIFEVLLQRMFDHDTPLSRLAREHDRGLW